MCFGLVYPSGCPTLFLPFVKPIKVFDEKYIEFNSQNKEIVFFWTKVSCKKEYTKLTPYVENF
ncbi:hypothetical protein D2E16_08870 [Streptococcus suis]|nr:hypothetical protein D2E16_08870 [Streptococcus suis]